MSARVAFAAVVSLNAQLVLLFSPYHSVRIIAGLSLICGLGSLFLLSTREIKP